jgi:SAM-dependent methyltransferase
MTEANSLALFDADNYLAINTARWTLAQHVIGSLRASGLPMETAYDLGAGPGWFAGRLSDAGFDVVALEGREDVAAEGRRRTPQARFEVFDFDDCGLSDLRPERDFALGFGILYHLENPLRALRIMSALTRHVLLLETMTLPSGLPAARVIRENPNVTQGVRPLAMLLSPAAIEQGLWAAGFSHVYRCARNVAHEDFSDFPNRHRRRHIWLAARRDLDVEGFEPAATQEPRRENYWQR